MRAAFPSPTSEEELSQQLPPPPAGRRANPDENLKRREEAIKRQQHDDEFLTSRSDSTSSRSQASPPQQEPVGTPLPAVGGDGEKRRGSLMSRSLRGAYNFGRWALKSAMTTVTGSRTDLTSSQGATRESQERDEVGERPPPATGAPPPPRELANRKLAQLADKFALCAKVKIRVCTWNVALQTPERTDLRAWVLHDDDTQQRKARRTATSANAADGEEDDSAASSSDKASEAPFAMPDLVVVGLQEVELGGAAIIMEMTEASVAWTEAVTEALNKVASERKEKFYYFKLQHAQLVGMAQILIGRSDHVSYISNTKASVSRTGVMSGMVGNKGSIGIRTTFYGRRFLFICAHFHPHAHNGEKRCDNYHDALSSLNFSLPVTADDELDIATMFAEATEHQNSKKKFSRQASNVSRSSAESSRSTGFSAWTRFFAPKADKLTAIDNEMKLLDSHDYVFFFGDLNFRLVKIDSATIRRKLSERGGGGGGGGGSGQDGSASSNFRDLLEFDELAEYVRRGKVFGTFAEPPINFPPTYKFDLNSDEYDTSPKRRDPAWTDRILYRCLSSDGSSSKFQTTPARRRSESVTAAECSGNVMSTGSSPTPVVNWLTGSDDGGIAEGFQSMLLSSTPSGQAHGAQANDLSPPAQDSSRRPSEVPQFPPPPPFTPSGFSFAAAHKRTNSVGSNEGGGYSQTSMPVAAVPFDVVPNGITVESYDSCRSLRISDHRPVSAQFEANVLQFDKEQLQRAMFELRELLPELGGHVDELAFV